MIEKTIDKKELLQKFRTEGILDAAIKVIAEKGLERATMEQVAEEAGISKATIYLYFKNKEALYYQCVVDRFERMLGKMREAASATGDPLERIRSLISIQLSGMEKEKDFFRVFLTENMRIFMDPATELGQGFWQKHEEYSSLVTSAINDGIRMGRFKEIDPGKGFSLLFSMVRGMAMGKIFRGDETPLSSEADFILNVFFNGIKKEKVASPSRAGK